MSDTPRTDSYVAVLIAEGADADSLEHFARNLERELNAANARIARLEEAGDVLANAADKYGIPYHSHYPEIWREAKDAKP